MTSYRENSTVVLSETGRSSGNSCM